MSCGAEGRLQVAFLTGQSDPGCCALSPVQQDFLQRLRRPGRRLLALNFPYREDSPPHAPVPLLWASWRNAALYLRSRRPSFAEQYRGPVTALLARAPHTVLLAGSCGLELLANLQLPPAWLARVSVFAYGPVARSAPACRLLSVRGQGDWISRGLYRGRVDAQVRAGHMDYLQQDAVWRLCDRFIDEVAALEGVWPGAAACA